MLAATLDTVGAEPILEANPLLPQEVFHALSIGNLSQVAADLYRSLIKVSLPVSTLSSTSLHAVSLDEEEILMQPTDHPLFCLQL